MKGQGVHLDLAITGANVITMDGRMTRAEAVGVVGGRIFMVGSNSEIGAFIGPNTRAVDAQGRTLVPGFQDSHMHPLLVGQWGRSVQLEGAKNIPEMLQRVKERAEATPKGQMILGYGWNQELMEERRYPTRWEVDTVAPDHPVFLLHWNGHIYLINTLLMEQRGITDSTPSPEGGEMNRNDRGEFTGVLLEKAVDLVIPGFVESGAGLLSDLEEVKDALRFTAEQAVRLGLTSLVDVLASDVQVRAYQELEREGRLPVRISYYLSNHYLDRAVEVGLQSGFGDDKLHLAGIKVVSDGSLSSHTAALRRPYVDMPQTSGVMRFTSEEVREIVLKATANGLRVDVHALGDRAVEVVLAAFREARGRYHPQDPRFKISHCIILGEDLIRQMAELGVVASVQPCFVMGGMHWIPRQVPPEVARYAHAFRSLIDAGVHCCGGTDAPICPMNPLLNMYAAVTRKDPRGLPEGGWHPEQRVSAEEALRMVTVEGAYSTGDERSRGSIEVGKLADLALLSHDPLSVEPDRIKDIRNLMTIVGGKVVYSSI